MIRLIFGLFILFFFAFGGIVRAQISEGGTPMKPRELKSSARYKVEMPSYLRFFKNSGEEISGANKLKSLQFAYPYEVNLTPENSGEWFSGDNDYAIWKLTIRSEDAYSMYLIFNEFELPAHSRLFIYSETEEHLLGAFTDKNNSPSRKFAIAPVAGDEITVQLEMPESLQYTSPFRIVKVLHDYTGILKSDDRRPLGLSGSCNINVNCESWEEWGDNKNSVVRSITESGEVCSGVLVNNTAENQKPFILSAAHCYDRWNYPETTVYVFNYESPFCKSLDGDPFNSISGAVMKAQFDSLDFALVQLNTVPPPEYQPYYAGWNRSTVAPQSTVSIHHPQGDIKKLANDLHASVVASFGEATIIVKSYTKNGFWWIKNWEKGTTERGSSGGPLFGDDKLLRGTLTGGDANCNKSIDDYYNRFSMAWDFKSDTTKQLKYWLDPIKSGVETINGKQFNTGENLCGTINNLTDNDSYSLIPAFNGTAFAGYWGGSNSLGITEVMEKFTTKAYLHIQGVSLGVAKFKSKIANANSSITIKVYTGFSAPDELVYTQSVKTSSLTADALNYIKFTEPVVAGRNFFVGFELNNIQPLDSFAVYQSLRAANLPNQLYLKINNQWSSYKDNNDAKKSMVSILELVACNINDFSTDTPLVENPADILVFPNPVSMRFTVEAGQDIPDEGSISVLNLLGQECTTAKKRLSDRKVEIDMGGNVPGIYFVRFNTGTKYITEKISYVPW